MAQGKDVRTRLSGALREEFEMFQKVRRLSTSETLQILIQRGLEGVQRDRLDGVIEKQFAISVQSLMISQRLLSYIDPELLELARQDSIKYLEKNRAGKEDEK